MRYVTVRVSPTTDDGLHPLMATLAAEESITREVLHRVEMLDDGSCVMLGEARGDRDRFEQILADSEYVYDFALTGTEHQWYSYSNFEPTELSETILAAQQEATALVETPVEPRPDGSMDVTLVGDEQGLREAMPPETDGYTVEVLETGDRAPRAEDLFACLTPRQQTVLSAALERGYYADPREATHEDLAESLDIAPSTVGEHLRKIEARVFSQFSG